VSEEWVTELGAEMTRDERKQLYGGSTLGGIQPSKRTPNVFLYTDPVEASKHGYNFDGWAKDSEVYFYTGEGQVGDQRLTAGNKAIAEHQQDGRALRLFKATGKARRPGGKVHSYLGEFIVDPDLPAIPADAPDTNGDVRSVLVFRLKPVGDVVRLPGDGAPDRDISLVADSSTVPLEQTVIEDYETSPRKGGTARRREADLMRRFKASLESMGHEVARWRIRPPGELRYLYNDLFDITANDLYEAKGSISRDAIRMAVGQLLDYRRHLNETTPDLLVLLPDRPSDDLLAYITSCGMSCVYATSETSFVRHS
jgi:hypothetical protein